jgi:hypothetical protein
MGGFPRTWGNNKEFTDELLQLSVTNIPIAIIEQLRYDFERMKVRENWPEDAKPSWSIRWTYTEPWAEEIDES